MMVSFKGIGQWCATFMAEEAAEDSVVKITGEGTVGACNAGESFCGVVVSADKDACAVQLGGFAEIAYSGTAPSVGYVGLAADGNGGVKTAADGKKYWVADRNTGKSTVTILL